MEAKLGLSKDLALLIIPHQNFKRSGGPAFVINDTYRIATSGRNGILLPKLFWPTVRKNCSSDLKHFANSWPSASNFKSFSQSLEQFFLTADQNNFGNKIPIFFRQVMLLAYLKNHNLEVPEVQYFTPEKKMAKILVNTKFRVSLCQSTSDPICFLSLTEDFTSKTSVMRCYFKNCAGKELKFRLINDFKP